MKSILSYFLIYVYFVNVDLVINEIFFLSPKSLADKTIKDFAYGKFSEIQYGKKITGFVYYSKENFCNEKKLPNLNEDYYYEDVSKPDNAIFILVDHTNECNYSKLAYNAKLKGASLLIIASDNDDFKKEYNTEDKLTDKIKLPTIIIKKSDSFNMKELLLLGKDVQLSVHFKPIDINKKINIKLFLSSDSKKSLMFFSEFKDYYENLKDYIEFQPIYKFYECSECEISNSLSDTPVNSCIRAKDFCSFPNNKYNIDNSRLITLENLRQKCIYRSNSLDTYWTYMVNFYKICLKEYNSDSLIADDVLKKNLNNIKQNSKYTFTSTCSLDILSLLNIDKSIIDKCMIDAMENEANSLLEYEDKNYEGFKVYRIPTLVVNESKYKGNWYSHLFFETLCNDYFSHEPDLCLSKNLSRDKAGIGSIILIVMFVVLIMVIVIVLYKKFIERFLDETIADKIKKQTQGSLGQYHIFKDKENSIVRKGIDVVKN